MKIKIHGVPAFLKLVKEYQDDLISNSIAGLIKCQNTLLREAMQITPIKTGNLVRSYSAPIPTTIGSKTVATVENSAEYALRVHEMPDEGINWTKPGTGPKFLERPLFANTDRFLNYIRTGGAGQ